MDYETEEQQVEALKRWWEENGRSVIAGVVLGAVAIGGWQSFGAWRNKQALSASTDFAAVMNGLDGQELPADALEELVDDHGDTVYGVMARFAAARDAIQKGDLSKAEKELRAATKAGDTDELQYVARIRLARVLNEQGKHDDALKVLSAKMPANFEGLVEEAKGDIYHARGDFDKARAAYEKALNSGAQIADRATLTMKLDDLAVPGSDS